MKIRMLCLFALALAAILGTATPASAACRDDCYSSCGTDAKCLAACLTKCRGDNVPPVSPPKPVKKK
jgi:hypothetical protein